LNTKHAKNPKSLSYKSVESWQKGLFQTLYDFGKDSARGTNALGR